jgi:hypothetical protein
MRNKSTHWALLTVLGLIALSLLARHTISPPKARAQRSTALNNVRSVSMVITNTSVLPGGQPGTNK